MAERWITPATPEEMERMAVRIRHAAEQEIMDTLQTLEYIRDNKGVDIEAGRAAVSADDLLRAALKVPPVWRGITPYEDIGDLVADKLGDDGLPF